jgi:hypothetical protein
MFFVFPFLLNFLLARSKKDLNLIPSYPKIILGFPKIGTSYASFGGKAGLEPTTQSSQN